MENSFGKQVRTAYLGISMWPPKPEIITSVELWQIASKFQHHISDFRWCPARRKISQMIVTAIDYQKLHDWRAKRLCYHFRLSVVVAVVRDKFICTGRGRKPQICRWNYHPICRSSRDISISGFGGHITISGCQSLSQSLGDTLFGLAMVENPGLAVGISALSVVVPTVV